VYDDVPATPGPGVRGQSESDSEQESFGANPLVAAVLHYDRDYVSEWAALPDRPNGAERLAIALGNQARTIEMVTKIQGLYLPALSDAAMETSLVPPGPRPLQSWMRASYCPCAPGIPPTDPLSSISDIDLAGAAGAEVLEVRPEEERFMPIESVVEQIKRLCSYIEEYVNQGPPSGGGGTADTDGDEDGGDQRELAAAEDPNKVRLFRKKYVSLLQKLPAAFSCCLSLLMFLARSSAIYAHSLRDQDVFLLPDSVRKGPDRPDGPVEKCSLDQLALSVPDNSFIYQVFCSRTPISEFWSSFILDLETFRTRLALFIPVVILKDGRSKNLHILPCITANHSCAIAQQPGSQKEDGQDESEGLLSDQNADQMPFLSEAAVSGEHTSPAATTMPFVLHTSSAVLGPSQLGAYYFPFFYHLANYQITELEIINLTLRARLLPDLSSSEPPRPNNGAINPKMVDLMYQSISNTLFAIQAVLISFLSMILGSPVVHQELITTLRLDGDIDISTRIVDASDVKYLKTGPNVFQDEFQAKASKEPDSNPSLFSFAPHVLTKQMVYAYSPHCMPNFELLSVQGMLEVGRRITAAPYYRKLVFDATSLPDNLYTSNGETLSGTVPAGEYPSSSSTEDSGVLDV